MDYSLLLVSLVFIVAEDKRGIKQTVIKKTSVIAQTVTSCFILMKMWVAKCYVLWLWRIFEGVFDDKSFPEKNYLLLAVGFSKIWSQSE